MKYPKKLVRLIALFFLLLLMMIILTHIHRIYNNNKLASRYDTPDIESNEASKVTIKEKLDYEKGPIEQLKSYLIRPTSRKLQLNYTGDEKTDFSQFGQSIAVDEILSERRDGFFVECGSASGEHLSNTLYFELKRNWTGLLVEANPVFFRELFGKQRNAYLFTTCVGPSVTSKSYGFKMAGRLGGLSAYATNRRTNRKEGSAMEMEQIEGHAKEVTVMCFPLSEVLDSIFVKRIDYLSLEVQGAELDILRTIDFRRMDISVISLNYFYEMGDLAQYQTFFEALGTYEKVMTLPRDSTDVTGRVVIFRKKRVLQ